MKINVPRIAYISIFLIYFSVPVLHDILPLHAQYRLDDWLAILGVYVLGGAISIPMLLLALKHESGSRHVGKLFYLRIFMCFLSLVLCLGIFWHDGKSLYVSLPFLMIAMFAFMTVGRSVSFKSSHVFKDETTGFLYTVNEVGVRKLSPLESKFYSFRLKHSIPLLDTVNTIETYSGTLDSGWLVNPSTGLPMNVGMSGLDTGGNTNADTGISINPVSGLPMNGGMSGFDVAGNSWGTTSSNPSGEHNTYDPNRGY